jgi:hypothetical protein
MQIILYSLLFLFSFAVWTVMAFFLGVILTINSFKYSRHEEILDGKRDCYLKLSLGPFEYRRKVPEKEEETHE